MVEILSVENSASLPAEPENGQIVYCENEKSYKISNNGTWNDFNTEGSGGVSMSLYELNRQVIGQFPPLDDVQLNDRIESLNAWRKANYYMIYGKEISYFTVLKPEDSEADYENFGGAIISLLAGVTETIYALDIIDDNTVEIWINYEGNPTVMYLFNYDGGIVTYGR